MHKNIMLIALVISSSLMGSQEKLAADTKQQAAHALTDYQNKNFNFDNQNDRAQMHALAKAQVATIRCAGKEFATPVQSNGLYLYINFLPLQDSKSQLTSLAFQNDGYSLLRTNEQWHDLEHCCQRYRDLCVITENSYVSGKQKITYRIGSQLCSKKEAHQAIKSAQYHSKNTRKLYLASVVGLAYCVVVAHWLYTGYMNSQCWGAKCMR